MDRKIAFSAFVQYAGKIVQLVFAVLTIKMLSNFLSQYEYGIYLSIVEYGLFFSTAANLGIFANTIRKLAPDSSDGKVFGAALVCRLISAFMVFAVALLLLLFTQHDTVFLSASLFFLASLFFDYVTSVCDAALQAKYRMGRAVFALILGRIVNFSLVFVLVHLFRSSSQSFAPVFFLAPLAGSVVTMFFSYMFVRKFMVVSFGWDKALLKDILLSSLPFGIINILNSLYFRFLPDYFVHQAVSEEYFASFVISFRIAEVLSLFSTFLMFSVLPMLRKSLVDGDHRAVRSLYKKAWIAVSAVGFIVVVFGSLFGPMFIELLTHKKYVVSELQFVLPMLLVLAAISYGYDVILLTLFALKKDFTILKGECVAFLMAFSIFLLSFAVSDPFLKIRLIALGAITGETFMVLYGIFFVKKFLFQAYPMEEILKQECVEA